MIKLNKGDNAIVSIGEYIMRLSDTEIPLYITTDFEEDDAPNLSIIRKLTDGEFSTRIKQYVSLERHPEFKAYIFPKYEDITTDYDLTPVGVSKNEKTKHLVFKLYKDNSAEIELNPEFENPLMNPKIEDIVSEIDVTQDIDNLSEKIVSLGISKFKDRLDNLALTILNSYSEDDITTIFNNLSNSQVIEVLKILTPERVKAIVELSVISEKFEKATQFINDLKTEINDLNKEIDTVTENSEHFNKIYGEKLSQIETGTKTLTRISDLELKFEEFKKNPTITDQSIDELTENESLFKPFVATIANELENLKKENEE